MTSTRTTIEQTDNLKITRCIGEGDDNFTIAMRCFDEEPDAFYEVHHRHKDALHSLSIALRNEALMGPKSEVVDLDLDEVVELRKMVQRLLHTEWRDEIIRSARNPDERR